jgi:GxxExxY protein
MRSTASGGQARVLARVVHSFPPMTSAPIDDTETFKIIGAAIQVHNVLGGGLFERVYVRAVEIEFDACSIPAVREPPIEIEYRGVPIGAYRPDFVCYGSVIVEIKAGADLVAAHYAQTLHYLMASKGSRALLLNFGRDRLQWKRFFRA